MSILTRRGMVLGLPTLAAIGNTSLAMAPAATDARLVVILLRGALDGMSAVEPFGDPHIGAIRRNLQLPPPGTSDGLLKLDGFFGLHPSLAGLHGLYEGGDLLPIHAVAAPYRSRSHFEAQDFMEFGSITRLSSGWMNRLAGLVPPSPGMDTAIALGLQVPVLLRGPAKVGSWAPEVWQPLGTDFYNRLVALHARDPVTGPALVDGLKQRGFSAAVLDGTEPPPHATVFTVLAERAGLLLAAPDGPRLAALEILGWDTHGNQTARLARELGRLDEGIMAMRGSLGSAWTHTVVVLMTEFGRTAVGNGSGGTDHGTAGVAFLAGGAVAGGRVLTDWPGLGSGSLLDGRDLRPTTDLYAVIKGVLTTHLSLGAAALTEVFPASDGVAAVEGLLRG